MKKIMLVFGTRPEAIKIAPLVLELQKHSEMFKVLVCVTAQHRQMLDQVLDFFAIKPDYDLNIMHSGQDLYDVTSRILLGLRDVLKKEQPDIVLVHGDTTTSMSASLASFYQRIPVGHVEAGLRTCDLYSPWPEELNRQIVARISILNFAPTVLSRQNLLKENIPDGNIFITGNTIIDALKFVVSMIGKSESTRKEIHEELKRMGYDCERVRRNRRLVLITGHRRENFGEGFVHICSAIKELNHRYPDVDFVYPMHLNPNVRIPIHDVFGDDVPRNMFFIEPLDYLPFIFLMEKSHLILTDSGGVQEEAPGLGKPVVVMRETTERPEAVRAGTVKLVGTDQSRIIEEISRLLDDSDYYATMSEAINPYGDGNACRRIVEILKSKL